MGCINFKLSKTPNVGQSSENTPNLELNEKNWNCLTSKKLLTAYFEHLKEEEENRNGNIRSNPADGKKLTCSPEEYQQSVPILRGNTWHTKLCKCFNCLKFYQDHNVEFLFGIKTIECLPTEILLKIFNLLVPSVRRVASECCKRFLEIWLCDDFIDDRRLVFDYCVLDPEREPLSTLLKSSRNYRTLVFGFVNMKEASVFAGEFGENITTIELRNYYPEPSDEHTNKKFSFFSQFPNLKTIQIADFRKFRDLSNMPTTSELLMIIVNNRLLHVGDDVVSMLQCYLDKTCDLFRVELNFLIATEQILRFNEAQRNKIQSVHLSLSAGDDEFKLPRFDNLKCLELFYGYSCGFGTEEILDNLKEQLPALKDLSIEIIGRLPHKNWTCLKTLRVEYMSNEELSRLKIFENLKELALETQDYCFFVHETFLNKNLKTLTIDSCKSELCFTCFQTMTKSFPALENLTCNLRVTNDHLEKLATNTPKLKCLRLEEFDHSLSFACLPNLTELKISENLRPHMIETWPLMLNLRKLDIGLNLNFDTVRIFERMPALEDLWIFCKRIDGDQPALFDALTRRLKRLKRIWFNCNQNIREIYPEIIDVMANNCKFLQRIEFNQGACEEILEQLLQKHSSLRYIDSVWLK